MAIYSFQRYLEQANLREEQFKIHANYIKEKNIKFDEIYFIRYDHPTFINNKDKKFSFCVKEAEQIIVKEIKFNDTIIISDFAMLGETYTGACNNLNMLKNANINIINITQPELSFNMSNINDIKKVQSILDVDNSLNLFTRLKRKREIRGLYSIDTDNSGADKKAKVSIYDKDFKHIKKLLDDGSSIRKIQKELGYGSVSSLASYIKRVIK